MFVTPAFAQAAGGSDTNSTLMSFIPLILIFVIMYFLMIRPQQKKAKEHRAMIDALRRGDHIVTQGGLIGKVVKVNEDNSVDVQLAENVKVKVVRNTIARVMERTESVESAD